MEILPKVVDRVTGVKYMSKDKIVIWNGKQLWCEHSKRKDYCIDCCGSRYCEHKKRSENCKDCDGSNICRHNKHKNVCKDCKGSSICEHNKRFTVCKLCNGGSFCIHNKYRHRCVDCGGGSICVHNRERTTCRDCKGGSFCIHNTRRSVCKICKGGSICQHNRTINLCVDCGGGSICEHDKQRRQCKICSPDQYLTGIMRRRVLEALKKYDKRNKKHTFEYVGCNLQELREHLEKQFNNGMTWDNQGDWHIDHIRPCASFDLSKEEERHKCFHFTNLQPLWAFDNLSKGAKYCQEISK